MSRIRTIKPGFFINEDLAYLPPLTRLLFIGLWTLADREGRLEDRPKRIKAELLPYDECDVSAMLDELAAMNFILRYQAADENCIAIPTFLEHQRPHVNEVASVLPKPPEHNQGGKREQPRFPITERGGAQEQIRIREQEQIQEGKEKRAEARPVVALAIRPQEPPNLFRHLLGVFCALWQARYGQRYMPTPSDNTNFGRLLKMLDPEQAQELPARWKRYLHDEDQFVAQKMRHNLTHFCTQGGFNKYGVEVLVMSSKEATAAAAEKQWLEFHGGADAGR